MAGTNLERKTSIQLGRGSLAGLTTSLQGRGVAPSQIQELLTQQGAGQAGRRLSPSAQALGGGGRPQGGQLPVRRAVTRGTGNRSLTRFRRPL